ncbi:PREDICTED: two pore calcium channel protein 1-like [Priapulus caudatus]|uniref:Two pore calcium channel protein 1-like n=1 Tax=Priapulus caudatus TaxID=37621 RepID=A0ABM1E968_PRICU|nr:PREDICTED: two pore calcium channel protein 1-like [Priapulus caudatus]
MTESDIVKQRTVSFFKDEEVVEISLSNQPADPGSRDESTHIAEFELQLASIYVLDASAGRSVQFYTNEKAVRYYKLYHNPILKWALTLCITINLLLVLCETPTAVKGLALPSWATMVIETACIAFFISRFIHGWSFTKNFWKDEKNIIVLITVILIVVDMLVNVVMLLVGMETVRWSRAFRPLFVINFAEGRQIRRAFRNIRRTLADIINVLVLFFVTLAIFTLMATKIFIQKQLTFRDGSPYFHSYFESFYQLFVLVTTSNSPDVMMPAYDQSRWNALFFIVYIIVCLFVFMSIILAVIFSNYKKNMEQQAMVTGRNAAGYFRLGFDLFILVNAIFLGAGFDKLEIFFLVLFSLEILMKLYTFGWTLFISRFWNIFDFIVIGGALVGTLIEAMTGELAYLSLLLDILLVLRVVRLTKTLSNYERFHVILSTMVSILPSILTYGSVIFVFYYIYAIIGMEVFGGLITYHGYDGLNDTELFCGNAKLEGSEFYTLRYCNNNFNDFLSSMVVLFELTVVNQWHVITEGHVLVTSRAARLYFISFYIICVLILLNIFTAFVLEAFLIEYSFSKSQYETAIERKIFDMGLGFKQLESIKEDKCDLVTNMEEDLEEDRRPGAISQFLTGGTRADSLESLPDLSSESGIKFHISKSGHRNMEVLLQRMFSDSLNGKILTLERSETDATLVPPPITGTPLEEAVEDEIVVEKAETVVEKSVQGEGENTKCAVDVAQEDDSCRGKSKLDVRRGLAYPKRPKRSKKKRETTSLNIVDDSLDLPASAV